MRLRDQFDRRSLIAASLALLLIAGVLCAFTLRIYPTGDDGWYELCKLQGLASFSASLSDRPLTALVYRVIQLASGSSLAGLAVIHTLLWLLLAVESLCLSLLLWRSNFQVAVVAALLTLAPVIVKSYVVTITYDSATVVPVVMAYAGILLYVLNLKQPVPNNILYAVGLLICFVSGLFSEYGFCASLAGSIFLIAAGQFKVFSEHRRTLLAGIGLFVATALSYVCFSLFFSVLEAESKKNVVASFKGGRLNVFSALVSWVSHSISLDFGALAREFGSLQYQVDSKSTLLAFGFGSVVCLLTYLCANHDSSHGRSATWKLYVSIAAAIAVAIFPFMLAGRNAFAHDLNTRYYLPALPFVAIGIPIVGSALLSANIHRAFLLAVAFLCGNVTITYPTSVLRHEQRIVAIGSTLKQVASSPHDGITLFVLAREENSAISLTGKATALWPAELRKKTWIVPETEALDVYGPRQSCVLPERMELNHRGLLRQGPLAAIYYVDAFSSNEVLTEPYCRPVDLK